MLPTLSTWLREQRLAHGWSIAEMGRQIQHAAKASNDHTIPSAAILASYVRRWEAAKIAPTERYQLYYCKALDIHPGGFGSPGYPSQPPDPAGPGLTGAAAASPGPDPTAHQREPGNGQPAGRSPLPIHAVQRQPPPGPSPLGPVNGASPRSALTVTITIHLPPGATAGITSSTG